MENFDGVKLAGDQDGGRAGGGGGAQGVRRVWSRHASEPNSFTGICQHCVSAQAIGAWGKLLVSPLCGARDVNSEQKLDYTEIKHKKNRHFK